MDTIRWHPWDSRTGEKLIGDSCQLCLSTEENLKVYGKIIWQGIETSIPPDWSQKKLNIRLKIKGKEGWDKSITIVTTLDMPQKLMKVPEGERKKLKDWVELPGPPTIQIRLRNERNRPLPNEQVDFYFPDRETPWTEISDGSGLIELDGSLQDSDILEYQPHDGKKFFKMCTEKSIEEMKKAGICLMTFQDTIRFIVQLCDSNGNQLFEEIPMKFWINDLSEKQKPLWGEVDTSDSYGKIKLAILGKHMPTNEGKSNYLYSKSDTSLWCIDVGDRSWVAIVRIWENVTFKSAEKWKWKIGLKNSCR